MARAVRKPVKKILNQENAILRLRQLAILWSSYIALFGLKNKNRLSFIDVIQ